MQGRLNRERLLRSALIVAVVAIAGSVLAAIWVPQYFFYAYLSSWLYWLGLSLGCLVLLMIHHLSGGQWGFAAGRALEAGTAPLPLLAVGFIPIALGLEVLYPWARAEYVALDPILQHKEPYLNPPMFFLRAGGYFLIWIGLMLQMRRKRAKMLRDGYEATWGIGAQSGLGLVLYGLTITFASVDWAMSLEPHWFSSIYGVLFAVSHALAGLALATLISITTADPTKSPPWPTRDELHDLGNLMLALTMVWMYISFMQFLIMWYGNLPEETPWYLARGDGAWGSMMLALVAFHFAVPFLLLLSRSVKKNPSWLAGVALGLLAMEWLHHVWLVMPAFPGEAPAAYLPWLELLTTAALGGVWLAVFAWKLPPTAGPAPDRFPPAEEPMP